MTLEEKVSQMLNDCQAIPRLGIPAYNFWSEGLHGMAGNGRATVFPQAIGLAATWDDELPMPKSQLPVWATRHYWKTRRGMQFCLSRTVIAPTSACQRLRLVGFQRTKVQAGESKTLKFVLSSESMMFVDENGEHRLSQVGFA